MQLNLKSWRAYVVTDESHERLLADTDVIDYDDMLDKIISVDPSPLTWSTMGLVPPSPKSRALHYRSGAKTVLLSVRICERILPRSVIMDELAKRGAQLLRQEGDDRVKLTGKETAQLKSEIVADLLPKTVIKTKTFPVLIRGNYIVIGNPSAKVCEDFLNKLRTAMGSLKVIPFGTQTAATEVMRQMLRNVLEQSEFNDMQLKVGTRAKLDHSEGAQFTVKGEDLSSDHVQELIDDDYYPIELSMRAERDGDHVVSFVTNKAWVFKSFKPVIESEKAISSPEGYDDDEEALARAAMAQFDGDLMLLADVVFSLLDTVITVAGGRTLSQQEEEARQQDLSLDKAGGRERKATLDTSGRPGNTPAWINHPHDRTVFLGTVADLSDGVSIELTYEEACYWRLEYDLPKMDKKGQLVEQDDEFPDL